MRKFVLFLMFIILPFWVYCQDDFPRELPNIDPSDVLWKQEVSMDTSKLNKIYKEFHKLRIEPGVIQSIIDVDNVWSTPGVVKRYELKVCFNLLKADLIYFEKRLKDISNYANEWSKHGNLYFIFDFKNPCDQSRLDDYHVKISKDKGNFFWSSVGRQAKSRSFSMNLPNLTTVSDSPKFRRQIIHEFGHSLGLVHEQFHPSFSCDLDFEKIKSLEGWSSLEEVVKNYRPVLDSRAYDVNAYDSKSIMHYAIRREFVKLGGVCTNLPEENLDISPGDAAAVLEKYPKSVEQSLVAVKSRKDAIDRALVLLAPFFKSNVDLLDFQLKVAEKSRSLENKRVLIEKNSKTNVEIR